MKEWEIGISSDSSFTLDHVDGDTVYLKTADGTVVNADTVQTADRSAIQMFHDSTLFGEDGAKAYIKGYSGGDAAEYRKTFTGIYNQTRDGANANTVIQQAIADGVPEQVAQMAVFTGVNAYQAKLSQNLKEIQRFFDRSESEKILESTKQASKGQQTDIERENAKAAELEDVRKEYREVF